MAPESEAVIYREDIIFFGISLINYLKNSSFSLSILDALWFFLADLNSNFSIILFPIYALNQLSKASFVK